MLRYAYLLVAIYFSKYLHVFNIRAMESTCSARLFGTGRVDALSPRLQVGH